LEQGYLGKENIRRDVMADFVNKLKYFIGIDDLDVDDEYDEYDDEYELEELPINTRTKKVNNKVVNIHTAGNMKLVVHEPLNYEDAPKIVDDLKMRKTVVVNLEQLEPGIKRQIFDFINGGLYSLEGSIQKVTKDIFVLAPSNVEIDGNIRDELKNRGVFQW
jgi:cell division inhibitor SepF